MTGSSAKEVRIAVVNLSPNHFVSPVTSLTRPKVALAHVTFVGVSGFARGNPGARGFRRIEESVIQLERCEELALSKFGE